MRKEIMKKRVVQVLLVGAIASTLSATVGVAPLGAENELNNTTTTPVGETVIVLPQNFTASTQKLHIEYCIKTIATDSKALLQKADLYCHNTPPLTDDNKWEMGKRYTYNLVIGLDKIYFAPSVTDWTDVNVTVPQI